MENTLKAIYYTLQTAPFVALLLVMPYTLYDYSRKKSVNVSRSSYLYIYFLYFICAFFMTLLPLPSEAAINVPKPLRELVQLVPLRGLIHIIMGCFMDVPARTLLKGLMVILFNVLLTMPLGFFLRFLFGYSKKKVVMVGFITSLMYELTQLTGLWFYYPRPYRIFDVDDLIANTLGAFLGYLIAPYLARFLPGPDDSSAQRLALGSEVAFLQRALASAVDFCMVLGGSILLISCFPELRLYLVSGASLLRFPIFFVIFLGIGVLYSAAAKWGSLGCRLAGLQLFSLGGKAPDLRQRVYRSLLINSGIFAIPFWVLFLVSIYTEYVGAHSLLWVFLAALLMMCAARNLLEMMFNAVTHGSSMFYDRLCNTYLAYGKSRKRSVFGVRVMDIRPLSEENVDRFSAQISERLLDAGINRESVTKVRLMAEGVMLDWVAGGLASMPCELRMDERFKLRSLILSVAGENISHKPAEDSYVDMFGPLGLSLDTYYAAEKNICIIHIP